MKRYVIPILLSLFALSLTACDSLSESLSPPQPTPVVIVTTPIPTITPTPTTTPTVTPTPTPTATPTEIIAPTATPFPCDEDSGRIEDFNTFRSQVGNGENLRYRVYLPPCYVETEARFPVVYLLHGLSYREQQWEEIGVIDALNAGIREGTLAPMILVMPYFGQLGQMNSFPPRPSYETHILEELMPAIDRQFCTRTERDYRAIGGISRGGFWAYSIAFRHPDVFGIVGGHSAFFPSSVVEIPPPFNPLELAADSERLPDANLRMYMNNGAADSAGPSQQRLSDRLREREIAHVYVIHPSGEHNNDYWSAHVVDYLAFYGQTWPRQYSDLPPCRS